MQNLSRTCLTLIKLVSLIKIQSQTINLRVNTVLGIKVAGLFLKKLHTLNSYFKNDTWCTGSASYIVSTATLV